jgi:hypothetical protein
MDIKEQLLVGLSRVNADYIANYIGTDAERFRELIQFVFENKPLLSERASWVVTNITDKHPEMLKPYLNQVVSKIHIFKHHGTRRNMLRSLASIDIPEKYHGKLFDDCYRWLQSKDELPAVKVHSMQILYNISKREPDLLRELQMIIEELTDHESAAIRSRSKEILKRLRK